MKDKLTIGVDIGGTHTDAVLVDHTGSILSSVKCVTTSPLEIGFKNALLKFDVEPSRVESIRVGTTHATNAILQANDLTKVGIIRIAGHNPMTIPPCYGWPESLRNAVVGESIWIDGGYECDGRAITPFNLTKSKIALMELLESGVESLAVTGVFSPLQSSQELELSEYLGSDIPISLSHQIGGVGFIERENATVLNASLKRMMANGLARLEQSIRSLNYTCPLYITQNDGSLISLKEAIEYPILTLSAGQTNSFSGGTRLSGLQTCVVVDIGGTSTDIGLVKDGIPRRSLENCSIGGIHLNFPMPDVHSIALGGGSHIGKTIGPQSCGKNLFKEGLAFGGNQLTLTDVSLKLGIVTIAGACVDKININISQAQAIMDEAVSALKQLVNQLIPYGHSMSVVLVGGGAALFPKDDSIVPNFYTVANAYGAAMAEIAGKVDQIVSLQERETVLEGLRLQAIDKAISKGACRERTTISDFQILPYHYMPGNKARVMATAKGPKAD